MVKSQTHCDGRFCIWCHNVIVAEVLNEIRSKLTYSTLMAKLLTEGKSCIWCHLSSPCGVNSGGIKDKTWYGFTKLTVPSTQSPHVTFMVPIPAGPSICILVVAPCTKLLHMFDDNLF